MTEQHKDEAIHNWIEQGEIPDFDIPTDDTIMGRGFCNGDCHACPDLNKCVLEYNPEQDMAEL